MRDLHRLARERLGPAAAALKTRDELEAALGLAPTPAIVVPPPRPAPAPAAEALVTSNFFVGPPRT